MASATHAASVAPDEKEPPSSRSLSISVFSTASYVRDFLGAPLAAAFPGATVRWFESRLHDLETAQLAAGADVVCLFVNDKVTAEVAALLHRLGVRLIVMRCAGFDRVDVAAARALGIPVVRVPAYSPSAIAEHAVALLMCLNRNLHKAYARVREGDFTLNGLVGFNVAGKTVGVVGTGRIGLLFARIMAAGFGAKLLGVDLYPVPEFRNLGGEYVSMEELVHRSDSACSGAFGGG